MPAAVAMAARAAGRPVFVVALRGHADPATISSFPHIVLRLGAAEEIQAHLRANGVRDVVLVGSVRRPTPLELRPDALMRRLLLRLGRDFFRGDDGLLGSIVRVMSEEGYRVLGAHEVMRDAIGPMGQLTRAAPDTVALADIQRGIAVARALGAADVGQGCVVQQGLVLAVEAAEGTDAMLARAGTLARKGEGGVLVKLVKPAQDRRIDLPTIGPATVEAARQAGLRGIAYEAEGTMIVDRPGTIAAADAAGLFLLGLGPTMLAPTVQPGDQVQ